jgi:predicted nucleic acid-binding protein
VKLREVLSGIKRIALDTACVIYYIENHPHYADKIDEVIERIEQEQIETLTSVITLAEVLVKPFKVNDKQVEDEYRGFLQDRDDLVLLPIGAVIAEQAAQLRAKYNLKLADALQVGTAIASGCDAFLTNDAGIKRVSEITVLVLDELDPAP